MRSTPLALTGPAAAAAYRLDGFRDLDWPLRWCGPRSGSHTNEAVRTSRWKEPVLIGEVHVAPIELVLRHLGNHPEDLRVDSTTPEQRIELALEHALRDGMVSLDALDVRGARSKGDALLRLALQLRRDEPPTESYAETRADQFLRSLGYWCWRQVPLVGANHRVDFVLPARPSPKRRPRPVPFRPGDGLIIEIDSREFHERAFERDRARQTNYDRLGYRWVAFTPNQIERSPLLVAQTIEAVRESGRRNYGPFHRPQRRFPGRNMGRNPVAGDETPVGRRSPT